MENTSGKGSLSEVPKEVKRWNWGGFWLTWVWGLFNGTYIALLALLPVVNIIMAFYLGAKGNELAWRNRYWYSVEGFHESQKKWARAGWIFGILLVTAITAKSVNKYTTEKLSYEITQQAVDILEQNEKAKEFIGGEFKIEFLGGLSGADLGNGTEWKSHMFTIKSDKGSFWVFSSLGEDKRIKEIKVSKFNSSNSQEEAITIDTATGKVQSTGGAVESLAAVEELEKLSNELLSGKNIEQMKQILMSYYEVNKERVGAVYFANKNGDITLIPDQELPNGYDPRERPWYFEAARSGQYKSEAYTEALTGKNVRTFSKAVYKDKEFIGVLGVDLVEN